MTQCVYCKKEFIKKSYQQRFCCPRCKQRYWDKVKPNRHKDPYYYDRYNAGRDYGNYKEECVSIFDDAEYQGEDHE